MIAFNVATHSKSEYLQGGGALYATRAKIKITGKAFFKNNIAHRGGAVFLFKSCMEMIGETILFENNIAIKTGGGGIYAKATEIVILGNVAFFNNSVLDQYLVVGGGAIHIDSEDSYFNSVITNKPATLSGKFVGNKSKRGGAIYAQYVDKFKFRDIHFVLNSDTALVIERCKKVTFYQKALFINNLNGGLQSAFSTITFLSKTQFLNNTRYIGGAVNMVKGGLFFTGPTLFEGNRAEEYGGAIYAAGTPIQIEDAVAFNRNEAGKDGGAIYLDTGASLTLSLHNKYQYLSPLLLNTSNNYAARYGGAIYHNDNPTNDQCLSSVTGDYQTKLPECFLSIKISVENQFLRQINSQNDTAGTGEGHFLFGGLLNRCQTKILFIWTGGTSLISYINVIPLKRAGKAITSAPYELCFCPENNNTNCGKLSNVMVYRGQAFNTSLLAAAQKGTTFTSAIAKATKTARLEAFQTTQFVEDGCHTLQYKIYSTESYEQIKLYTDGPYRDVGKSIITINATILPCPNGFIEMQDFCDCENRLQKFDINIENTPHFVKQANTNFMD